MASLIGMAALLKFPKPIIFPMFASSRKLFRYLVSGTLKKK
jgi:hypothetical protein